MLLDFSLEELNNYVSDLGLPKFRAKQIFDALYMAKTLDEITNLPKDLKENLSKEEPILATDDDLPF